MPMAHTEHPPVSSTKLNALIAHLESIALMERFLAPAAPDISARHAKALHLLRSTHWRSLTLKSYWINSLRSTADLAILVITVRSERQLPLPAPIARSVQRHMVLILAAAVLAQQVTLVLLAIPCRTHAVRDTTALKVNLRKIAPEVHTNLALSRNLWMIASTALQATFATQRLLLPTTIGLVRQDTSV